MFVHRKVSRTAESRNSSLLLVSRRYIANERKAHRFRLVCCALRSARETTHMAQCLRRALCRRCVRCRLQRVPREWEWTQLPTASRDGQSGRHDTRRVPRLSGAYSDISRNLQVLPARRNFAPHRDLRRLPVLLVSSSLWRCRLLSPLFCAIRRRRLSVQVSPPTCSRPLTLNMRCARSESVGIYRRGPQQVRTVFSARVGGLWHRDCVARTWDIGTLAARPRECSSCSNLRGMRSTSMRDGRKVRRRGVLRRGDVRCARECLRKRNAALAGPYRSREGETHLVLPAPPVCAGFVQREVPRTLDARFRSL